MAQEACDLHALGDLQGEPVFFSIRWPLFLSLEITLSCKGITRLSLSSNTIPLFVRAYQKASWSG